MTEEAVLGFLEKNEEISDSGKFAEEQGINHADIINAIKNFNGFRLVNAEDIKRERWVLSDEGKKYAESGSPEVQLFLAIPAEGVAREELQKKLEPSVFKIGCQQAIKNKWVEMGKSQVSRKVKHVEDRVKDLLLQIQNGEIPCLFYHFSYSALALVYGVIFIDCGQKLFLGIGISSWVLLMSKGIILLLKHNSTRQLPM